MTATAPRPYRAAAIIGLAAQILFTLRLATPHKLVFDEVHYVPAARVLLQLQGPVNIEHPLLGKELIALGITLITQCPWCIDAHVKRAEKAGATEKELGEVIFVSMAMASGAAWSHGGLALQCQDDAHKPAT